MTPRPLTLQEANIAFNLQRNLTAENALFFAQLFNGEQTVDGLLEKALTADEDQVEPLFACYNACVPPTTANPH